MYSASATKHRPTIRNVVRSTCSRREWSRSWWSRHSNAAPDVTSIRLSRPKPTRETDPAINPGDDGNQTFGAVVGDGEVFEPLAPANEVPAINYSRTDHNFSLTDLPICRHDRTDFVCREPEWVWRFYNFLA